MASESDRIVNMDVVRCARCGRNHPGLIFTKLTRPNEVGNTGIKYTHWAACPTNGEPILMRFENR